MLCARMSEFNMHAGCNRSLKTQPAHGRSPTSAPARSGAAIPTRNAQRREQLPRTSCKVKSLDRSEYALTTAPAHHEDGIISENRGRTPTRHLQWSKSCPCSAFRIQALHASKSGRPRAITTAHYVDTAMRCSGSGAVPARVQRLHHVPTVGANFESLDGVEHSAGILAADHVSLAVEG